jgi:hemerythrin-like metal-binding protein
MTFWHAKAHTADALHSARFGLCHANYVATGEIVVGFTSSKMPTALLEMGIPEIDDQHRKLFELLEQLRKAMLAEHSGERVDKTLGKLEVFARAHFAFEERLMADIEFADHAAHAAEHEQLMRELVSFRERARAGDVTAELPKLIRSWIIEHLVQFDRKYSDYLLDDESDK